MGFGCDETRHRLPGAKGQRRISLVRAAQLALPRGLELPLAGVSVHALPISVGGCSCGARDRGAMRYSAFHGRGLSGPWTPGQSRGEIV